MTDTDGTSETETENRVTYWDVFKMGVFAFVRDFRRICSWFNPFSGRDDEPDT